MDTVTMRSAILQAKLHEQRTRELAVLLKQRLKTCVQLAALRDINPLKLLMDFVDSYINRTPDLLEAIYTHHKNTSAEEVAEALINNGVELFVASPALLQERHGLNGAMCRAFLCQRLIEEVNDSYLLDKGEAFTPLNITRSNLIAHLLIGEPFANLLEEQVYMYCCDIRSLFTLQAAKHYTTKYRRTDTCNNAIWSQLSDSLTPDITLRGAFGAPVIH